MTLSVIVTGATGMVGEGVLLEYLDVPRVGRARVLELRDIVALAAAPRG